jgi:hypothetical protein
MMTHYVSKHVGAIKWIKCFSDLIIYIQVHKLVYVNNWSSCIVLEDAVRVMTKALQDIDRETAICRSPHDSSHWDCRFTRQLGYKHNLSQNVVSTKKKCSFYFRQNVTFLSGGLLKIGKVFFLSPVKLCVAGLRQTAVLWAMWHCCRRNSERSLRALLIHVRVFNI